MHIETLRIRSFRRFKDVWIDITSDHSIFVGANNSGKTSASHAFQLFLVASHEHFSVHAVATTRQNRDRHTSELPEPREHG